MTTSRRTSQRTPIAARRRAFLTSGSPQRRTHRSSRLRGVESLETRSLLAGDAGVFISDYWNYKNPHDVNDDGIVTTMDLLAIVNDLSAGGVRQLPGTTVGGGNNSVGPEGESSSGQPDFFIDPTNDGLVSMMDLLTIVNQMTAEGEGSMDPALIRYKLEPVAAGTNTLLPTNGSGQYLIQEGDYYELRVLVQDTGQTSFGALTRPSTFDPDGAGPQPAKSAFGLTTAFLDLNWDTSRTDVEVVETQIVEIGGTPTGDSSTFTISFNGFTTDPIAYSDIPVFTAVRIRDAMLLELGADGRTDVSNLRNIEVEPETPSSSTRFRVRFIHDLSNQDFTTMSGAVVNADGATGITVEPNIDGNPSNAASYREMYRGRVTRNQNSASLAVLPNNPQFFDTDAQPPFINADRVAGGVNDAGSISETSLNPSADRSGVQLVEVFRLRMKAIDGDNATPVSFVGSVTNLNVTNNFNSIHGFTAVIPANRIVFDQTGDFMTDPAPELLITEQISAVNDSATINEGPGATVLIDVLANDVDANPPPGVLRGNLQIQSFTQPAFGSVVLESGQLRYTVPNADFNGVATFQYTIQDGALTDTGTVTVTVKATNDSPTIASPGTQIIIEDVLGGLIFSTGNGNAVTISDVDAGTADVQVTLTTTGGTLTLNPMATGDLTTVNGDGTGSVTAIGTVAEINAALSGLRFTPTLNSNGATSIGIAVSDLGNTAHPDNAAIGTANATVPITVNAVNDAPVLTVPGGQTVDESAVLTFTGSNLISVVDVDADVGTVPFLTVTLTAAAGSEITPDATSGASIGGSGTNSATISGSVSQVNNALDGLTYRRVSPLNDTLTVNVSDNGNTGSGPIGTDQETIAIQVVATARPRALDDVFPLSGTFQEGAAEYILDVLLNDLVNLGETPQISGFSAPAGFTLTVLPANSGIPREHLRLVSTDPDFFGQVTFTYTLIETDNVPFGTPGQLPNSGPDEGMVTVTITNVNDAPVGVADSYTTDEDVTLGVSPLRNVLGNDTDADNLQPPLNAGLTAQLVAGSAVGGTVSLNSDGTFSFVPTPNFNGAASFQYRALDGQGGMSNPTTVSITVTAVNDNPIANPDTYQTFEEQNLTVLVANSVLNNDTDADNLIPPPNAGLIVDLATVTQPAQGSVAMAADGSFTYTLPNSDFNGQVTFTYRARDPEGNLSAPATVTITVFPVNDLPVAGDATYPAVENQQLIVLAANGLLRAVNPIVTDVDTPLSGIDVEVVSPPAVGTLNLNNDTGAFTYSAPTEFNGQVTFTYRATDDGGVTFSNVGTITIDIAAVNNAPTANNDNQFVTDEDTALIITAAQLLGNDTDPENNPLTISQTTNFSGPGSFVDNLDGTYTFTPSAGFPAPALSNTVTFQYRVTDGPNQSNLATVTITVNEVNDDPIANDDTANFVVKNIANQLISPNPKNNDSSGQDAGVPGEILVITSVGGVGGATAQGGTVTLQANGNILYTPATDFVGTDSFVYTLSDSRNRTDTATVTFEVLNFAPKTVGGTVYIDADDDGVIDAGEQRLAGTQVRLSGTTILGAFDVTVPTDASGNYLFTNLAPGDYVLEQIQPLYLTSGKDASTTSSATAIHITNVSQLDSKFAIDWDATDFTGNITGLNFGERGINAASLTDASGLLGEILASSANPYGMILSADALGNVDWSYCLQGWTTTAICKVEVAANGSVPSVLITIGGVTKRIYQDPSNNHGGNTPPTGSLARFRVLGQSANGDYIIRLDGTLADFGFVAVAPVPAAEGEGPAEMADGQYREAADEVFAEESWA